MYTLNTDDGRQLRKIATQVTYKCFFNVYYEYNSCTIAGEKNPLQHVMNFFSCNDHYLHNPCDTTKKACYCLDLNHLKSYLYNESKSKILDYQAQYFTQMEKPRNI